MLPLKLHHSSKHSSNSIWHAWRFLCSVLKFFSPVLAATLQGPSISCLRMHGLVFEGLPIAAQGKPDPFEGQGNFTIAFSSSVRYRAARTFFSSVLILSRLPARGRTEMKSRRRFVLLFSSEHVLHGAGLLNKMPAMISIEAIPRMHTTSSDCRSVFTSPQVALSMDVD